MSSFVQDSEQADADAGIPTLEAEHFDAPADGAAASPSLHQPSPRHVWRVFLPCCEGKVVRVMEPFEHSAVLVARATPEHLMLASHAITLAVLQGVFKGDMAHVGHDAVENAQSMTEVGGLIVHKLLNAGATRLQPDVWMGMGLDEDVEYSPW